MFGKDGNFSAGGMPFDYPHGDALLGAINLIEYDVYDAAGKCLGAIEDIVLDARTGCVRYASVAFGGFLGIGCRRVAVPWSSLTPDANFRRCVVNLALMNLTALRVSDYDPLSRTDPVRVGKVNAP